MFMWRKTWKLVMFVLAIAMFTSPRMAGAGNLIKDTDSARNWLIYGKKPVQVCTEKPRAGDHCLAIDGSTKIFSKDYIPVDMESDYKLSGWFRSSGEADSKFFFGVIPYDKDKKEILPQYTYVPWRGTETVLVKECKKGDKQLWVKNASKWKADKYGVAAFEIDDSGDLADLPNFKITGLGIAELKQVDGSWRISLKKPCSLSFPKGTKVREQRYSGNPYLYCTARGKVAPRQWREFSGNIKPVMMGGDSVNCWRPGTAFVKVIILANHGQYKQKVKLDFDGISLEKVE